MTEARGYFVGYVKSNGGYKEVLHIALPFRVGVAYCGKKNSWAMNRNARTKHPYSITDPTGFTMCENCEGKAGVL